MFHHQEWVVVLLQDGPELDRGEGPPHYQLDRAAVQSAEDARADAYDKEDPELLEVGVAVKGRPSISSGAMRTLSVSGSRETAGRSWISMIRGEGFRILGGGEGRAKVRNGSISCSQPLFAPQKSSITFLLIPPKM